MKTMEAKMNEQTTTEDLIATLSHSSDSAAVAKAARIFDARCGRGQSRYWIKLNFSLSQDDPIRITCDKCSEPVFHGWLCKKHHMDTFR
jgi:hypothetical protein